MPKKTAYSRSGAQRNKTKQKSFALVRPVSDEHVLGTVESSEVEESEAKEIEDTSVEREEIVEVVKEDVEEEEREIKVEKKVSAKASASQAVTAIASADPVAATGSPRSAASRLAARRQAAQKSQRSSASLITAEHYSYVRRDLIFILILAIIMFGTIVVLHFVLGG